MKLFVVTLFLAVAPLYAAAQQPLPIIDMHLHATDRDSPWSLCVPWVSQVPTLDPTKIWEDAWSDIATAADAQEPSPLAGVGAVTSRPLVLTNVTVIDVQDGARHRDRTVVIEENRITTVGRSADIAIREGALVVDARGRYLIPGLWDMHVHSAAAAGRDFPVYLALGVTGVRNMHTTVDTALELTHTIKRRLADGTLRGPRIVANGPVVDGPVPVHRGSVALGTPEAARAAVDSLAAGGADFIKVYERLPRNVYFAIVEQAKRRGIPFDGHVPTEVRVAEAADAGQRSIEHADALNFECSTRGDSIRSTFLTQPPSSFEDYVRRQAALARTFSLERCAEAIAALRRNATWFTPTLALFWGAVHADSVLADTNALAVLPPEVPRRWEADAREAPEWLRDADAAILEAGTALVGALHRAGVPLLAGTDVGNPLLIPGYSLHKELELFAAVGLTPLGALQTATIHPARFLAATDSLGTVEPGKLADLVLLDADPLEDIRNIRRIRAVIANGRYYDRAALDGILSTSADASWSLVSYPQCLARAEAEPPALSCGSGYRGNACRGADRHDQRAAAAENGAGGPASVLRGIPSRARGGRAPDPGRLEASARSRRRVTDRPARERVPRYISSEHVTRRQRESGIGKEPAI